MKPVAIAAACLAAFLAVSLVLAHAEPARVTPGDGAVLVEPPSEVVIIMTQDMARQAGANDIDVFNEAGDEVTAVAAVIDNSDRRRLSVPLPTSLEPGVYTIHWKTLSDDDGDTDEGELSFTYDPQGTPDPGQEDFGVLPTATPGEGGESPTAGPVVVSNDEGMSWVLVVAVGIGMFVIGGVVSYVFLQKRQ